jgi:large subunit ribosomal protein L9
MEVILLEEINKIGKFGETVNVAAGFGRNFLLPKGKAIIVNSENRAYFEQQKEQLQAKALAKRETIEQTATALAAIQLQIAAKTVSSEGKLFGSITNVNISKLLEEKHDIKLDKKTINVPDHHIRQTGEYKITITLDNELIVQVPLKIIGS